MGDPPHDGTPVLAVRTPSMADRLRAVPDGRPGTPGDRKRAGSERLAHPTVEPPAPENAPVSVLKRLERYFSAFFKLGRLSRTAKSAAHSVSVLEPRLDALSDDLLDLSERHVALGDLAGQIGDIQDIIGRDGSSGETLSARIEDIGQELGRFRRRLEIALGLPSDADTSGSGLIAQVSDLQADFRRASEDLAARLATVEARLDRDIEPVVLAGGERLGTIERRLSEAAMDSAQTKRAYGEVSRRLDAIRFGGGEGRAAAPEGPPSTEGLDALLEAFYGRLEDRYRGAREEIKGRLRVYLADVEAAATAAPGKPVLDLGCGRGEWIELLTEQRIAAEGVDLNAIQIAEAKAAGLDVREGDALKALADAPDNAYAAITAHHLVEHLPFRTVSWMTREALRVLAPGGVLIYETPNARNLIVGATTFHIDPTHVRPVVAEVLTTLMDTLGFHPIEARPLHPSETREAFLAANRADPYIAELLFGPQDLAILATKPAPLAAPEG